MFVRKLITKTKLAVLVASLALVGCKKIAVPITESRADLQADIGIVKGRFDAPYSHIYAYDQYLIATVSNQGFAVIDNSIPESPEYTYFIQLPGAKDAVIHDGVFATQQYADLVLLSVNDQKEIGRVHDVYDYKDYLQLPSAVEWKNVDIEDGEVVVDYSIEEAPHGTCFFVCL